MSEQRPETQQSVEENVGARLRQVRETFGLSQRALARKTGVANATISMIENGQSSPSVGALKRILDGLPMDLASFFSFDLSQGNSYFYKASDLLEIGKGAVSFRLVGADRPQKAIQMLYETFQPGADTGRVSITHEGEECGIVVSGKLEVTVGEERRLLGPGDAWYFESHIPHKFRNTGSIPCLCISACTPPTF
ncbi:cupin domain-containing protein [Cohaesibacter gelatinilyticus]|uniref:Transcriptional regulator, XRE family with cupin sensor n=1 Tax=Cohaesibacter gelatinilyticus TaxID=372072 RepID=A0A285PFJ8_9HYPH|nr:cupin domain-containing protein [Cohaesibacter gelatinilyticus]SNZ20495.1 transcriptional regulator, XRE family with cupin sensor [Cohaesibacter gelatinilyticus]